LNLQAKARLGAVVGDANASPIERGIQRIFGKERILKPNLISLTQTVITSIPLRFSGLNPLSNSRKAELLAWLEEKWGRIEPSLSHLIEEGEERNGIQSYLE
jgi:hypothetical protein